MQRFAEFIQHHPLLTGLLALVILALIVDEALRRMRKYKEVGAAEAVLLINKGAPVLDLRTPSEFSAGHIINAKNLPLAELDGRMPELEKYRGQTLILCCKDGTDAGAAATRLAKQGFAPVNILKGGVAAWQREQFPLERA